MPEPMSLALRARLHGVQPSYADVWGVEHEVPEATLVALLEALDAGSGEPEGQPAAGAVPPVLVVASDVADQRMDLMLPAGGAEAAAWTLSLEDGSTRTGRLTAMPPRADEPEGRQRHVARIDQPLSPGYHRLQIEGRKGTTLVIAAPARAALRLGNGAPRTWGPAVQLYALRSGRNWGIGDFSDLHALVTEWAAAGAGIVGLNPLHALFTQSPTHASPYSPSSRLWLNPLYIAVDDVADLPECPSVAEQIAAPAFQARLHELREAPLVDHAGVSALKLDVLQSLHRCFRVRHSDARSPRGRQFAAFRQVGGRALRLHAVFESLDMQFHGGWRQWPARFQDPESADVAHFAETHRELIEFHEYLQWQAALQLARVQTHCRELRMAVGLYLDMAVSIDPNGSDAWIHADVYSRSVGIGAPPDEFNPKGQGWGLAPLRPDRLRATQHRLFIDVVSRLMQDAGAIRIDHVMGLMRLFWIPPGWDASEGAYVHYPFDELLAIVKLESARHGTLVIGEDLGTVDAGVRDALSQGGVLSYRLLYFERRADGDFTRPADYPVQALAAISTHDLATFAGWWRGQDLADRAALDLFPDASVHRDQCEQRTVDRGRLVRLLRESGTMSEDEARALEPIGGSVTPELGRAVHALVGQTPAMITMVQLEDVAGVVEQSNMPGTVDEHPNWRRKLPPGGSLTQRADVKAMLQALDQARRG